MSAVAKQREAKPRHGVPVSLYLESAGGHRHVVELGRREDGARGHTGGAGHPPGVDDVVREGGVGIDYHPTSGEGSGSHRTHGLASGWRPHCDGLCDVGLRVHTDSTRRERWTPRGRGRGIGAGRRHRVRGWVWGTWAHNTSGLRAERAQRQFGVTSAGLTNLENNTNVNDEW